MQNIFNEKHLYTLLVQIKYFFKCEIKLKFDNTCIYCRLSKDRELSDLYLEPTTSRIADVVSSLSCPKLCSASPLPPVNPPPPPPRNQGMASMQYTLPSLEGGSSRKTALQSLTVASLSGTLGIVEAANQHSFHTVTGGASQNNCLRSKYGKLKVALTTAVLAVIMITVPVVYISFFKQKTEIPNINTTEIPNINTSVLTKTTDVPTVNSNLISGGMYISFIQ